MYVRTRVCTCGVCLCVCSCAFVCLCVCVLRAQRGRSICVVSGPQCTGTHPHVHTLCLRASQCMPGLVSVCPGSRVLVCMCASVGHALMQLTIFVFIGDCSFRFGPQEGKLKNTTTTTTTIISTKTTTTTTTTDPNNHINKVTGVNNSSMTALHHKYWSSPRKYLSSTPQTYALL